MCVSSLTVTCTYVHTELGAGVDEMALLEERAKKIAEDAKKDQPKPKSTMTFVK